MNKTLLMERCIDLAGSGFPDVMPNPMVGSLVYHDDKIIGEGFHQYFGGHHAEVNALKSVKEKELLKESALFVSLEPCSHFGKTPPCTSLIIESGIKKVIIASTDPNPLVSGKGIEILRNSGIIVETGFLEEKERELNRRFYTFHERKRPYIILKFAQTEDGFIARSDYSSKWISNEYSRLLVHKWRSEEMAILVGKNTAFYDNPQLNNRFSSGKNPLRLVIDSLLEIPANHYLLDQTLKTIVYNSELTEIIMNIEYQKLNFHESVPHQICNHLFQENIQSVIIEGGRQTIQSFVDAGLWDEARVFKTPIIFNSGIKAPEFAGTLIKQMSIQNNLLEIYFNK